MTSGLAVRTRMLPICAALAIGLGATGTVWAQATTPTESAAVHAFAQVGTGIVEIGHVEAGFFVGQHLTLEAMLAHTGVFGARYGGGVMAAIGHAQGRRPPRHALLVGARLMLNSDATFDSGGDDLSSYVVLPVGYGFLGDNGFYFRATAGLAVIRERKFSPAMPGAVAVVGHETGLGGPMITLSAGYAF